MLHLILIYVFISSLFRVEIPISGVYKILPQSKIYLAGTSNVNKFTCHCTNENSQASYVAQANQEGHLDFYNTSIDIPVVYIDCKNRKMDRDLQKAMKAEEYPEIKIDILRVYLPKDLNTKETIAKTKVQITLAGQKKIKEIDIHIIQSGQTLVLAGHKTLHMTEFNITPPEVLFGMIKVNDPITFYFELHLELEPKST